MIRNEGEHWFDTDEYFRLSTLYIFGEYFAWIRILELTFGFVPYESSSGGRELNFRLNGPFRALTSHTYFSGYVDVKTIDASQVPRLMLSAIGEGMTSSSGAPINFTDFLAKYADDMRLRRWFSDLESFLLAAHPSDTVRWDRLIATGATLRLLIRFLDPKGNLVAGRSPSNLGLLGHPEVKLRIQNETAGPPAPGAH
jgi:hypothetical protein